MMKKNDINPNTKSPAVLASMVALVLALGTGAADGQELKKPTRQGTITGESVTAMALEPLDLRCEFTRDPLGVDVAKPRLSWVCASKRRGARQTAYQVVVDGMWDSGKVASDQSVEVTYAGKPQQSLRKYTWRVRLWDEQDKVSTWSEDAHWVTGFVDLADLVAKSISAPPNNKDSPTPRTDVVRAMVNTYQWRHEFSLEAQPTSAFIAVVQGNYCELFINGTRVGEDVLSPSVSAPSKRVFYLVYDVAKLLRQGTNTIGIWTGTGRFNNPQALKVQLNAEVNGKTVVVVSDHRTWQVRATARWRCGGAHWGDLGGELVDGREESVAWSEAGGWMPPYDHWFKPPVAMQAHPCPANRIGEVIKAVAIRPLAEGRYEIDFGKNLTGWLRLRMPLMADGQVVKLLFYDRVIRDGSPLQLDKTAPIGMFGEKPEAFRTADGTSNTYQGIKQVSAFVSAGKTNEVFQHRVNYHGFRYVVVEGLPSAPKTDDATALLIESDLERLGSFACSDELVNRIHAANVYTLRCLNLGGRMVDCPHRERMGYGGDGQASLDGMMMNFHAARFYEKWAQDWRDIQSENGSIANAAPEQGGGGGPIWPGIIALMPWKNYLHYGNLSAVREAFPAAKRYAESLDARATGEILRSPERPGYNFLFDWLPPKAALSQVKGHGVSECGINFYRAYYLWQSLAEMARALGLADEVTHCEQRAAAIRTATHEAFYDAANKRYVDDLPSLYAISLLSGGVPEAERAAVLKNLERCLVEKHQGHVAAGMPGMMFLIDYLQSIGRDDLILAMYQKKTYPGWGYMLENDASTFWETWNGQASHIHSTFPIADNWLYHGLAGIRPDPAGPGFKRTIIKPAIVGDMAWVKASYQSVHGPIVSNWKREGDRVTMEVTIPANTTATVYVPARIPGDVTESGVAAKDAEGVRFMEMVGETAVFQVASGTYHFASIVPMVKSRKVAE